MAKEGFRVIDSDMHVYDPPDLYLRYMDPKWGERIPRGERRSKHGRVQFKVGGGTPLRPRSEVVNYGEERVAERYTFAVERSYDSVSQLRGMDMEGLDVAVLFRTFPLHCDDSFEPEYANDLCRAWNNWIAEFCKEDPERLRASALLTLHDVDLAVKEARRAVTELGAVCLSVCPGPVNGRRIHDRYFDPLWAEIERLGVALCFHPPANPNQEQVARGFYGHPNANIIVLALRNPVELILGALQVYWHALAHRAAGVVHIAIGQEPYFHLHGTILEPTVT
ncbi:MAG: amidohydrolase family protein [Deltaproteobacteria bacterium]|nr:amidohydrolase family protein [Deltaproteobacteria bacterium]